MRTSARGRRSSPAGAGSSSPRYSSHKRAKVTPLRLSSWWMSAHRGTWLSEMVMTGGGGNRRRSRAVASSSDGSGQDNPAKVNRRRYSPTVLRAIEQLRAIWRSESPQANLSRKTSCILRMDNLSVGILGLPRGCWERTKDTPTIVVKVRFELRKDRQENLLLHSGNIDQSGRDVTGSGGRLPPESVAGIDRDRGPASHRHRGPGWPGIRRDTNLSPRAP